MTTKINYKQNKKSFVTFLSLALAAVMLINAAVTIINASNNNFSAAPENYSNVIKSIPTPTPKAKNKRGSGSKSNSNSSDSRVGCGTKCQKTYDKAMDACDRFLGEQKIMCQTHASDAHHKCEEHCGM